MGLRESSIGSFEFFARMMQGERYFDFAHALLCRKLQQVAEHPRSRHCITIMPRGTYKTRIATQLWSIWRAIKHHQDTGEYFEWLIASNTAPNANLKLNQIKDIFRYSKPFKAVFPDYVKAAKLTTNPFELRFEHGKIQFDSIGVRGNPTGRHYNGIIQDDTCAPAVTDFQSDGMIKPSSSQIRDAIQWHNMSHPLLKEYDTDENYIVGTYWSKDDLLTHIQRTERSYKVFSLPAYDRDGNANFRHLNINALRDLKTKMGDYLFSCLYLNQPMDPKDMIFPPKTILSLEDIGMKDIPDGCTWYVTCDPAGVKETKDACQTAIVRFGIKGSRIYVDQYEAGNFRPDEVARKIIDYVLLDEKNTGGVAVESNAIGAYLLPIIQDLMNEESVSFPLEPVRATMDKDDRILVMQPYFKRRQFIIREDHEELRSQLVNFPNLRMKDIIDALAQGFIFYGGVERKVFEEPKEEKIFDIVDEIRRRRYSSSENFRRRHNASLREYIV